jgi:hypothetical protein
MGQESIYRKAYIWFLLVTSQHALVWKLWPIILDMRLWKLYISILPIKTIAYLSDYFFFSRVKRLSCIKLILMFLNQRIQARNACAILVYLFNLCYKIWLACVYFFTFNNFIGIFLDLEPCLINIPFETIGGGTISFIHIRSRGLKAGVYLLQYQTLCFKLVGKKRS